MCSYYKSYLERRIQAFEDPLDGVPRDDLLSSPFSPRGAPCDVHGELQPGDEGTWFFHEYRILDDRGMS